MKKFLKGLLGLVIGGALVLFGALNLHKYKTQHEKAPEPHLKEMLNTRQDKGLVAAGILAGGVGVGFLVGAFSRKKRDIAPATRYAAAGPKP